jgi:ADP-ribosylglycohydrolase
MLIQLAVEDAYGAGFEYNDPAFVREHNTLADYVQHSGHPGVYPGRYTDDTQMSIAVAETLLGDDWTPLAFASRFVECFHRDRRVGYAGRFYNFLKSVKTGQEFLDRIDPRSDKSGAAMRVAPVGLLPTEAQVVEIASLQARITHSTKKGVDAAIAAALAVHFFHRLKGYQGDLPRYLDKAVPGYDWSRPWAGKVGALGIESVHAAVTALAEGTSLAAILKRVVANTGDVDTAAAIAMAAGAGCTSIAPDLPPHLYATLEDGEYGRDFLLALDAGLRTKFGPAG